jgi:hypothetical protein
LPQAKILLSKVGGSSRYTGSNDGLYIQIEISDQAKASFYIDHEGTRAWGCGGRRAPPHYLPCKTVDG